jgi:hypothetical protein
MTSVPMVIVFVLGVSSRRSLASEGSGVGSPGTSRDDSSLQRPSRRAEQANQVPRASTNAATKPIDAECDVLIPLTKNTPGRVFSATNGVHGVWREYERGKEPDSSRASVDGIDTARVWRQARGATAVQMKLWPQSGDWVQVVDYCFLSDGSLARSESVLVTVDVFDSADETSNGVKRIRTRYFDRDAREVAKKVEVRNLSNGRPAKRRFADIPETIYRMVGDLPFAALLKVSP